MKLEEIIDKVIQDMMTKGEGIMYVDPLDFYKGLP